MARIAQFNIPSSTGLLKLPNEILLEIVSPLCTSDLRRLGRVNCRFRSFINDYLVRYRYNTGLFTLPIELILEIVQHLGRQKDRSHLAQASQGLYPLITDYIFRHNVRYGGSSLLNYAAKKNLNGMARMILHLGGDVNTQCGFRPGIMGKRPTPLVTAAFHGHERMVKMLVKMGASHLVDGMLIPLTAAIFKRHENVALILMQELESGDMSLGKTSGTSLQIACEAKLVNLVRYYLERKLPHGRGVDIHDLSTALYRVLQMDASDDAYQIVSILLKHGANPNAYIKNKLSHPVTIRAIAFKHPDSRVRNLISKGAESPLQIGRPYMVSSEDKTFTFREPQSEASLSKNSRYDVWWDFLEGPNAEIPSLIDEYGTGYSETTHEDRTLNGWDIADLVENFFLGKQGLKRKSEPTVPPPLSSFPQLGIPKSRAQHAANTFWAKKPTQASSNVSISGMGANSREVKQSEKPAKIDSFPQLARPGPTSNATGKDLWARFVKDKVSQSTSEALRVPLHKKGNDMKKAVNKSSKKKKWEPLLI